MSLPFEQRLRDCQAGVESVLADELGRDAAVAASENPVPPRLRAAMEHAVLAGGKRFRPFLVMETAALFGVPPGRSVTTAAALECLHCYSLVHDDLPAMDDDDMRRGRPSVHKAFDEWTAILAGDALLTLAFEMLAAPQCHEEPSVRSELVLQLALAAGRAGMAGGQQLDLDAEKVAGEEAADIAAIATIQAMKTGALITFACEAGAILGGAGERERQALRSYGDCLGRAFQISDDLLDHEGDAAIVGKAVGKDGIAGKATLVSLLGVDEAKAELARVEAAAIAALGGFGSDADILRAAAAYLSKRRS